MKIILKSMAKEQYKQNEGLTEKEFCECYGEKAERLYWIDGKFCGSYIGVKTGNDFAVYGCRRDKEGLTKGEMIETLLGEFEN